MRRERQLGRKKRDGSGKKEAHWSDNDGSAATLQGWSKLSMKGARLG